MSYLNILIGLGGTGAEVINDFLKIVNRYPLKKNKFEWFVVDSASLEEKFTFLHSGRKTRFVQLEGFSSSRKILLEIKEKYPESNILEIFPHDDYLIKNDISSHGGAWEIRKLGFLLLIHHLIKSGNNIFDKVIKSINKYSKKSDKEDDDTSISGIKIFIINSIAGGTGSGLFLPFAGFLKDLINKKILKNLDNFPLNIYSFLALPNFVARGSRAPHSDTTIHKYKANAFEAFLEIKSILSERLNWNVKLTDDYQFNFNPSNIDSSDIGGLIDNLFLFNDINVARKNIVIPGVTNTDDEYKPYFQEMAWCLYMMSCGNSSYYQNGPGNDLNKKGFAGIGILSLEFPKETILGKLSKKLYEKTPTYFKLFSAENNAEIQDIANTFKLSLFSFLKDKQKNFNEQFKSYKYELSVIGKDNIQVIQNKRPNPLGYDDNTYFKKYLEEVNSKIQQFIASGISVQSIYFFLKKFKEIIENEQAETFKKFNILKERGKTTERDLINQKKYKDLLKFQTDLFTQHFHMQNMKSYNNLLFRVIADVDKKLRFFWSFFEIFADDSIFSNYRIKSEEYFNFPPPFTEIGYSERELNKLQNEVLKEILIDYEPSEQSISTDNYEKELLKNIWLEFSRNSLNNIVEQNFIKYFSSEIDDFNANTFIELSKDLLELWYKFIKTFIINYKNKFISKRNSLVESFNNGKVENLSLSYPFIPLMSLDKNKDGKKAIFCNTDVAELLKGNDTLDGYEQATKYSVLDTDCLLLISSLVADKKFNDLELSDLKNSYEIMLKEDEKNSKEDPPRPRRYVFIDPRFGEIK